MAKKEVPEITSKERLMGLSGLVMIVLGASWIVNLFVGDAPDYSVWVGWFTTVASALAILVGIVLMLVSNSMSQSRKSSD